MISDCLKTRELLIVDQSDKVRIALSTSEGIETSIKMYDQNGKPALNLLVMDCDQRARKVEFFHSSGNYALSLAANENGQGIDMFNCEGKHLGFFGFFNENSKGNDTEQGAAANP